MKPVILFSAICYFIFCPLLGQTKLTDEQGKLIIQRINEKTSSIKSMKCNFVQVKRIKLMKNEMKSKGVMFFLSPNKLRWQYDSPYKYIFILNGTSVKIISDKSSQNINLQENKIFRQISNIILNSIVGNHLNNTKDFMIEVWKTNSTYSARLYPKKKELKSLYNYIELFFNLNLDMVKSVKMEEKTGDVSIINLINVEFNSLDSEDYFCISN